MGDPMRAGYPLALNDGERLKAVAQSRLLFREDVSALDQLTALVCDALEVPVALVSIVTDDRQIFASATGLPVPWNDLGETPLSHSFCQHVVTSDLPLQVDDAPATPLVCDNLAIHDLGIHAYLGTPVRDPTGLVLGALCAIDVRPRKWAPRDLKVLEGFSSAITAQLLARQVMGELNRSHPRMAEQETRIELITNTASVLIAALSEDFTYTYANRAYAELLGETAETLVGRHPRDVLGEDRFARVEPHLRKSLNGETVQYDLEWPGPDQKPRILRVHYAPQQLGSERRQGVVATLTDVTEQRLMSTLADRLDDRLKAAHQLSPDGFAVFKALRNGDNRIVDFEWEYTNEQGAMISGNEVQGLIGKSLLSVLPGNKAEGLFDAYVDVVNTGQAYRKTSFYNRDGLALWIAVSAIKLGDGFAVSFSDVSERKRSELAVADSVLRLQRVIDKVLAFIGVMTPEGILKEVNQPALDIAGLSREDVIGKPFWDTYWWSFSEESQTRLKQAIEEVKGGKQPRYDVLIRVGETEKIWIDFQLSPQFDANGKLVEMIPSGTDINERKAAESHRQLLVTELNHRVKNSLATIQAMARQTIRSSVDMESFERSFTARLSAISTAHEILIESNNARADLRLLIKRQVGPYVDETRQLNVSGGTAMLAAECAHSVGLVLHELATNAAKYGALSRSGGDVNISCEEIGDGNVRIVWTENGGPTVSPPRRSGFGSRLIKQSIEFSLGGSVDVIYAKDGVIATLIVPKEFNHG